MKFESKTDNEIEPKVKFFIFGCFEDNETWILSHGFIQGIHVQSRVVGCFRACLESQTPLSNISYWDWTYETWIIRYFWSVINLKISALMKHYSASRFEPPTFRTVSGRVTNTAMLPPYRFIHKRVYKNFF
jgi:hypothetical protein